MLYCNKLNDDDRLENTEKRESNKSKNSLFFTELYILTFSCIASTTPLKQGQPWTKSTQRSCFYPRRGHEHDHDRGHVNHNQVSRFRESHAQ
mmetsp:Transcript_23936/g.36895  ORF Transcript_23936/g.36895 Transcript_23936/m.36895 type:complete len:92 (-) Transcript_23936:117-392(-)